jgi:putative DNA methylase
MPPTPSRKKLIEVALPLVAINTESAREKSIRHGHPSTLHLWWARRPLAACRAVLFASLVDDPGNDLPDKEAEAERKRLFGIIEQLVLWDNVNDETVLHAARTEIARSVARGAGVTLPAGELTPEQVRNALEKYAPPVLDPFCGGGSIPLEAQRLGLRAYASDLNPVAVLITKALIEIPPKFAGRPPVNPEARNGMFQHEWRGAAGLADDVRYYGKWMRDEAEKRLGHLYPKVRLGQAHGGGEATVIAWLWARTVKCPNPACGAEMPLISSFWLSTRKGNQAWVEPKIDRQRHTVHFKVRTGEPTPKAAVLLNAGSGFTRENGKGKKAKATFRCLSCEAGIAKGDYIDHEADAERIGAIPIAIVAEASRGRFYTDFDTAQAETALTLASRLLENQEVKEKIPTESARGTFASNAQGRIYGFKTFADYFTARQLATLVTLTSLISEVRTRVYNDALLGLGANAVQEQSVVVEAEQYAIGVITYLAFAVDKGANLWSSLCSWMTDRGAFRETFARQGVPMVWDYAEANPFSESGGNLLMFVERIADVITYVPANAAGTSQQLDATAAIVSLERSIVSTDPPYYDNIGYADLSDFFYVWLRRSLHAVYPDVFSTLLVPKLDFIHVEQTV